MLSLVLPEHTSSFPLILAGIQLISLWLLCKMAASLCFSAYWTWNLKLDNYSSIFCLAFNLVIFEFNCRRKIIKRSKEAFISSTTVSNSTLFALFEVPSNSFKESIIFLFFLHLSDNNVFFTHTWQFYSEEKPFQTSTWYRSHFEKKNQTNYQRTIFNLHVKITVKFAIKKKLPLIFFWFWKINDVLIQTRNYVIFCRSIFFFPLPFGNTSEFYVSITIFFLNR